MKNKIKIELTLAEAIELRGAISARMFQISKEGTCIEYRTNTLQILMRCYDKVKEEIENNLKK